MKDIPTLKVFMTKTTSFCFLGFSTDLQPQKELHAEFIAPYFCKVETNPASSVSYQ